MINEQGFIFGSQQFVDNERSFRTREKFEKVAISTRLKARVVGLVEKNNLKRSWKLLLVWAIHKQGVHHWKQPRSAMNNLN